MMTTGDMLRCFKEIEGEAATAIRDRDASAAELRASLERVREAARAVAEAIEDEHARHLVRIGPVSSPSL